MWIILLIRLLRWKWQGKLIIPRELIWAPKLPQKYIRNLRLVKMFLKKAKSQGCSCLNLAWAQRNPSHSTGPEQQPIYYSYPSRLSRSLWCEEQQAEGKKKRGWINWPWEWRAGCRLPRTNFWGNQTALPPPPPLPAFAGAGVESPGDSSRGVKEERRERRWPKPLGQPGSYYPMNLTIATCGKITPLGSDPWVN